MNKIIHFIENKLQRINIAENRDNRIKFDPHFLFENKGLTILMWGMFCLTLAIMLTSSSFSTIDLMRYIALFMILNAFLFFHMVAAYHLRDVDKICWKNCYTGEWYREIPVAESVVAEILASPEVRAAQKNELNRLLSIGKSLRFIDLVEISKIDRAQVRQ